MVFWIAILGLAVAAIELVARHDAGTVLGFANEEFAQLVALSALALVIGSGVLWRLRGNLAGAFRMAAIWVVIAAILVITAANYGLSRSLGAHPFWSVSIAWIGVPIGLILAFMTRQRRWLGRMGLFALLLAGAGISAHLGRLRFAASFAEDKFAGQAWYFGWIAVAIFSAALISAILTPKVFPE